MTKEFWAVDKSYPHIITKHTTQWITPDLLFHETLEKCFETRRDISPEYRDYWMRRKEYDSENRYVG